MDQILQRLKRLAVSGTVEDKERYIRALERTIAGEPVEPPSTTSYTGDYGLETVVHTMHGTQIRCESSSDLTSFIRVCDEHGNELVYWTMDEIQEEPDVVVQALMGYAAYGVPERCGFCGLTIYDARRVSGSQEADWATLDGDFGCDDSPDTDDDGAGSHIPE